jgi:hypothetical protein
MVNFESSSEINNIELASSIKSIKDIFIHTNDIIKAIEKSPDYDPIIEISVTENKSMKNSNYHEGIDNTPYKSKQNCEPKHVISGSKAVTTFLELLREGQKKARIDGIKGCGPYLKLAEHFKSSDTDIFFLNSNETSRVKYDDIDIVHLKTRNISEHLDNFDLSCCKTSMSIDGGNFWISLHCLYTMLTGNCFIPKYLESPDKFRIFYNKTNNISTKKDFELFYESKDETLDKCTKMFKRLNERIEKYRERGYTFQYVETDKALSWITSNHMEGYLGGY